MFILKKKCRLFTEIKKNNNTYVEFTVCSAFLGTVDGDQVSNQEKKVVHGIGNKTDTSIELSVSKMDRGLTVVINGNPKRYVC